MEQKVLNNLSYGLFVITANQDGKDNGCICNSAVQVTSEPPLISVALNKAGMTCKMIKETKKCTISILSEEASFDTITRFGFQTGFRVNKFSDCNDCKRLDNGTVAITKGTNAYISLEITQQIDLGSHILFIGAPTAGEVLDDAASATYAYYFEKIKPKSGSI